MRKVICITIFADTIEMDAKINDQTIISDMTKFNQKQAHIVASRFDWMRWAIEIYLVHSEFPTVPNGCACMNYTLAEAQQKFPYLFTDTTDPIRYRKFTTPPNQQPGWREIN